MAKNKLYDFSDRQLSDMVDQYFSSLQNNPTQRGGPSDFLAFVHLDMETAKAITTGAGEDYKKHARVLKEAATRMRAHLETAPAWANGNSAKAIYLTKQELWDGRRYDEKAEAKGGVQATVRVIFGAGKEPDKAFD